MATPLIGQIVLFAAFRGAPTGWLLCQGQSLSINDYSTLFYVIGTTYGGDGQSTFNLPNLSSRVAVHAGQGGGLSLYTLGESAGSENVSITNPSQLPSHTHTAQGVAAPGNAGSPAGALWAQGPADSSNKPFTQYATSGTGTTMAQGALSTAGGGQPHANIQPVLGLNFIIAYEGVYPPPP